MDAVTRTFTFNDRFYAIYGTTAEREGGYRMSGEVYAEAFLPVAEQHVVPDDVTRLMSGDIEELQREHRILRRDGDLRDVVVRVTVARDATGRIVGTRGSNQDITDLRRLEAEREQFFTLFNIASDVMVIADPDGCFKRVNPAAIKLLGYSEEELLGRPFINFVHPDDRQLTLDEMARQIQVGRSMDVANRYVCKDGSVRWLSWRASYVAKEHATYATARDCTEQHLVEEALRDSEERFRSFFELSADLVCIADNDGRFRVVNSAFSNVLGYSKEELVSRAYLDFVHPEDRKKTLRITAERLKRGETVMHIENRYVRKNGEIVWLEWTSRASVSKGLTFAIARDITERKKTDERLLQVMAAVESSSNAIGISDLQRRHFYQNKAYTELFGYATAAELQAVGGGAATVCDPAVGKELFETILAGKTWSGELKLVTKRGRVFDAFERADAIKDEDGRSIGLIGVVTDISDRVAQQQRLHGLLAQAEQDARTKGELLREVNHRVTNNLTAVLGLISFELRHSRNDPQSITSALSRLNQHIRGMLVVHRLLSQSAWAPVSVQELAGKIIRAALSTAGWRRPAMLTVKPGELRVSPRQAGTLAMVINELATNTVKYASRPTGAVSVGFEFGSDINGIMLRYRDNGPGYPPDVLANERSDIGLKLITEMVTKSLGGSIVLSNDDGAVATLRIRSEEEDRT
jgi:PAS domain S-box-containing protein